MELFDPATCAEAIRGAVLTMDEHKFRQFIDGWQRVYALSQFGVYGQRADAPARDVRLRN